MTDEEKQEPLEVKITNPPTPEDNPYAEYETDPYPQDITEEEKDIA